MSMRCGNCGRKNKRGSLYCCYCGRPVSRAYGRINDHGEGSGNADKKSRLAVAALTAGLLVLIFGVTAVLLHFIKAGNGGKEAAVSPSPTPEITPAPTLTPTPMPTVVKPTRAPTPVPTSTPIHIYKPTPRPTARPTNTPRPTEQDAFSQNEDCRPVDAVCSFILYGDAVYARQAFPPEYITHTVQSYGFVAQLLGSEDAVIQYAGGVLLAGLKTKYGNVTAIEHRLYSRRVLTDRELSELCTHLVNYGMTTMPTEAHLLNIDLIITSDKGEFRERVEPHVLLIDGEWYIDPADIDF